MAVLDVNRLLPAALPGVQQVPRCGVRVLEEADEPQQNISLLPTGPLPTFPPPQDSMEHLLTLHVSRCARLRSLLESGSAVPHGYGHMSVCGQETVLEGFAMCERLVYTSARGDSDPSAHLGATEEA